MDKDVRKAAAEALGQIGDPRTVEPLIAALKDADKGVRWVAASALGQIGDERAVESLVAVLNDSSWIVCRAAAKALAGMYRLGKLTDVHILNVAGIQGGHS